MLNHCEFHFDEELNDFLPHDLRKPSFAQGFNGTPAVKDPIEALGVPHAEADLILVDGAWAGFVHRLRGCERVTVYPVFERFELAGATRQRAVALREPRFVLDANLGLRFRQRLAGLGIPAGAWR